MKYAVFFPFLAILAISVASPAMAQRVQFPSQLPLNTSQPPTTQPGWGTNYGPVAQNSSTISPPPGPYTGGAYGGGTSQPPASTFSQPGNTFNPNPTYAPQAPAYGGAPNYNYGPAQVPGYAPSGPTAQFQGTITAPPSGGWDPYATPGVANPTYLPNNPYLPGSTPWCCPPTSTNYVQTMQRFMDEFRLDHVWMPGNGPQELGIHDTEISASFAIPFLHNPDTPLLITPGFATNWFNGPSPPHPPNPHFPPRLYEAYLDTAWNPQVTPTFGSELSFRIGVYSDFNRVTNESIRYQGKGYALLSLSPNMQVKAGVQYLDRQKIKLLPAGGLIWTPNELTRFEILFPDPKLAWQLQRAGNMEWWLYGRGEYGGDSWAISEGGGVIQTDYNDYRVAVGLEFNDNARWDGYFEVGYAFEREIYQLGTVAMSPNGTVFLGGGLAY